jgi:hypothetical protein
MSIIIIESELPNLCVAPDCPVCHTEQRLLRQRSSAKGEQCVTSARTVCTESEQRQKAHRTVNSDYPVVPPIRAPTVEP